MNDDRLAHLSTTDLEILSTSSRSSLNDSTTTNVLNGQTIPDRNTSKIVLKPNQQNLQIEAIVKTHRQNENPSLQPVFVSNTPLPHSDFWSNTSTNSLQQNATTERAEYAHPLLLPRTARDCAPMATMWPDGYNATICWDHN